MASDLEIQDIFQNALGRLARGPELEYVRSQISSGYLNPMDLESILGQHPEAQQRMLEASGKNLESKLAGSDQAILGQTANAIRGNFADMGRGQGSSGMSGQLAQAGQNLAMDRQSTLAQFYGQGYQGLQQNAANLGANSAQQMYGNQNAARDFRYQDILTQKNNDIFQSYLNQQRKSNRLGAIGGLVGSGIGAIAGSSLGPVGAMAGASLGGRIGGMAGGF